MLVMPSLLPVCPPTLTLRALRLRALRLRGTCVCALLGGAPSSAVRPQRPDASPGRRSGIPVFALHWPSPIAGGWHWPRAARLKTASETNLKPQPPARIQIHEPHRQNHPASAPHTLHSGAGRPPKPRLRIVCLAICTRQIQEPISEADMYCLRACLPHATSILSPSTRQVPSCACHL
ncbi:uncharacterized protein BDZ99DRAFT_465177 [Mytilinidion resinicola]|uniref:Uncharacterized protein n=1 Tax=Mytilinidion resinicola TaxID=574789 RepID=A0A6A6YEL1_9PEZI|nr:uncharacterized protein BDZ99DRAFT_465177 [Mytilinidion resinicola]KAF2807262.1 hypothetical protein BDZ99DRAFT_465177 [Mytilinidion resinicola]